MCRLRQDSCREFSQLYPITFVDANLRLSVESSRASPTYQLTVRRTLFPASWIILMTSLAYPDTNVVNGTYANVASSFWTQQHAQDVALVIQNPLAVPYKDAVIGASRSATAVEARSYHSAHRSSRKDCVKQHIRRRHRNFLDPQVLTLQQSVGSTRHSSSADGLGLDLTPPQTMMLTAPCILQPQPCSWQSQWPFYCPGTLPGPWPYSG